MRETYGDKYDYSKVQFKTTKTPVEIVCPIHGSFKVLLFFFLKGRQCPKCLRDSQSSDLLAQNGSIFSVAPQLKNEWSVGNKENPNLIQSKSIQKYWWTCSVCGNEWETTPFRRVYQHCGCPKCGYEIAKKSKNRTTLANAKSLADNLPELAREWDSDRNGDLLPTQITTKSGKKVWWKCQQGHSWQAKIAARANGSGCPNCTLHGSSKIEIRLFSEVLYFFPDAELKKDIDGFECDIFIPSLTLGIEIDGYHWHQSNKNLERDQRKTKYLKSKINLIHLRDDRLGMESESDILMNEKESYKSITNKLFGYLALQCPQRSSEFAEYQNQPSFHNDRGYFQLLQRFPKPLNGQSFAEKLPEHLDDWDSDLNDGLSPYDIYPTATDDLNWKCHKCGSVYRMQPMQKYQYGSKCPLDSCYIPPKGKSLAEERPDLAAEWLQTKNKPITPSNIFKKSKRNFWWKCSSCGQEFEASPEKRVMYPYKYGCTNPTCSKKHLDHSVAMEREDLIPEWDTLKNLPLTPHNTSISSPKKVWWKCMFCGLERELSPRQRSVNRTTCGSKECGDSQLIRLRGTLERKKSYTELQSLEVIEKRNSGLSITKIAEQTGIPSSTIHRIILRSKSEK